MISPNRLLAALAALCSSSAYQPSIIQGGMGIRISSYELARSVSLQGELGVVSGTCIDTVLVRTLQNGDQDGDIRRALATFPDQGMVARVLDKYFIENGKDTVKSFKSLPMWTLNPSQALLEVAVLANYAEVWLAKHDENGVPTEGLVGINRLTKVQLPTLASLYGAMLADVDYVIMGAGIPLHVPAVLDNFAQGQEATFPVDVAGTDKHFSIRFSPQEFWTNAGRSDLIEPLNTLKRPNFIPIVSSVVLAQSMLKRASGTGPTKGIDGFVVELPTAGGHNAPPRGFRYDPVSKSHALDLNEKGEPVYGPKDEVDLSKFVKAVKGLPFWFAGSYAHVDKFHEILEMGGAGVQVGTLFSLAKESGMDAGTRDEILARIAEEDMEVFTDPVASPTGYPFKALELSNTLSDKDVYANRPRLCNLGYLRAPYMDTNGHIGYRCPAEPVEDWVKKGGDIEATQGRKCLCNALCANVGLAQTRKYKNDDTGETDLYVEDKFITIGDDVNFCRQFMKQDSETGTWSFSAEDVVNYLKSEWTASKARKEVTEAVFGTGTKAQASTSFKSSASE